MTRLGFPRGVIAEAGNTLLYAGLATLLAAICGFLVAAGPRLVARRFGQGLIRIAALGYALPGAILAIGLLGPLALADASLSRVTTALFGVAPAIIGVGAGGALVVAYLVRFLAVGVGACEAGLSKVPASLGEAGAHARPWARRHADARPPADDVAGFAERRAPRLRRLRQGTARDPCSCARSTSKPSRPISTGRRWRGTYEDGAVAALLIVVVGLIPVALLLRFGSPERAPMGG